MRAAIFRMPESILGEAEPALGRHLALLALGSTYRPLRQLARFPAQQRDSHVFELTLQGRVPLSTSLDPSLHLRRAQQIRLSNEDTFDSSKLEDNGSLSRRASLPLRHPQGRTSGIHRLIANPRRAREDRENSLPPCDLQLSLAAKSAYALAARLRASLLQPMRPFHGCASHSSCRRSPAADLPRTCLAAAALARSMLLVRWPCPAALCAVRAQAAPSPHPPGEQCSQTAHQAAHSHELAVQPVVR